MTAELAIRENVTELAARPTSGLALSFEEMTMRVWQVDKFYREVMQEGTDFGKIPGTDKPTLYQPGAQMLDQIFGYSPRFEIMPASVIDWQRPIPFFHYIICCRLVSLKTGETVAEGIGSCNSYEDKYRWRNAKRVCPDCKAETIIKGKQEYGGGWLCFKKNGGCGAKFRDGEAIIEDQVVGRTENEDTASLENTISKMAQKRAHIAATLNATGASRIFTQDIEDLPQFQNALIVESQSRPTPERTGHDDVMDRATARAVTEVDGRITKSNDGPSALERRQKLAEQLVKRTALAKSIGIDIEELDPADLNDTALKETVRALGQMITDAKAAQERAAAEQPPVDLEDLPF